MKSFNTFIKYLIESMAPLDFDQADLASWILPDRSKTKVSEKASHEIHATAMDDLHKDKHFASMMRTRGWEIRGRSTIHRPTDAIDDQFAMSKILIHHDLVEEPPVKETGGLRDNTFEQKHSDYLKKKKIADTHLLGRVRSITGHMYNLHGHDEDGATVFHLSIPLTHKE